MEKTHKFITTFLGIAFILPYIWGKQQFPELCIRSSLKCLLRRLDLLVETNWNNAKFIYIKEQGQQSLVLIPTVYIFSQVKWK